MHKLLSKLDSIKGRGPHAGDSVTSNSTTDETLPINQADVYKYRRHRGVNLGSWFVLERWITESPFKYAASPAQSDLDIARGSDAKQVLEAHWDTWITDEDWTWISKMGLNAVRIPIGYYHLCGADRRVLDGTDFANYHEVYEGAWSRIIGACTKAESLGIGVLLDLHAAPGGQNASSHSGISDPHPNFFAHTHNQRNTIYILKSLLQSLSSHNLSNIIGIELLNEPDPPSDTALTKWYTRAISELQSLNTDMPLYLGECWRTGVYAEYLANHPPLGMAVLDHHLYRCFTAEDIRTSVDDHIRAMDDPNGISHVLSSASEKVGRVGGGLVVGEWSGALNPGSLAGISNENEKKKAYVAAQLRMFDRSCGGWFFWTYKKEMLPTHSFGINTQDLTITHYLAEALFWAGTMPIILYASHRLPRKRSAKSVSLAPGQRGEQES
ncbi:Glucan 1,3-beta-glucosidase 3 [Psilocybe cubensis]|uniref:Glucan 1,3-beta-glucosidase 3 n=1 Tax=Psilocybe cubensis TaxID=181762 RepID=A0ACB8GH61_PSICU|nr:Glucan 1,3-beta-glucosidase 3 [Psilocybe cubensis]KAH9474939.1 Glucan 1,3-beta-glucosidase 3 [Psilocybe cubensis]